MTTPHKPGRVSVERHLDNAIIVPQWKGRATMHKDRQTLRAARDYLLLGILHYLEMREDTHGRSWGQALRQTYVHIVGEPVAYSGIYSSLGRLRAEGLVTSSRPVPVPQGVLSPTMTKPRAVRILSITAKGARKVEQFQMVYSLMPKPK